MRSARPVCSARDIPVLRVGDSPPRQHCSRARLEIAIVGAATGGDADARGGAATGVMARTTGAMTDVERAAWMSTSPGAVIAVAHGNDPPVGRRCLTIAQRSTACRRHTSAGSPFAYARAPP